MDLAFITSLPPGAQLVAAAAVAIIYSLVHFGIINGRKAAAVPKPGPDANEIVAITVDSRAINRLAGEAAGLSVAMMENAEASKRLAVSNRDWRARSVV